MEAMNELNGFKYRPHIYLSNLNRKGKQLEKRRRKKNNLYSVML